MRKAFFRLVAIAVMMTATTTAAAQLMLGVKGGLNLTQLSLNTNDLKTNRNGFFVGPSLMFNLPGLGLGFDAAALYDERDARIGDDPVTDLKQRMITLPVNLRINLAPKAAVGLFVYGGPQFGFSLNKGEKRIDSARQWKFRDSEFSVNVGAGISVLHNVQLSVNYNIVCGKTADITTLDQVVDDVKNHKAKMHAWQITAAIYL